MKTFKTFLYCLLAGRTALHLAAYPGNLPCLALLLSMEGVLVGPDFPRIYSEIILFFQKKLSVAKMLHKFDALRAGNSNMQINSKQKWRDPSLETELRILFKKKKKIIWIYFSGQQF